MLLTSFLAKDLAKHAVGKGTLHRQNIGIFSVTDPSGLIHATRQNSPSRRCGCRIGKPRRRHSSAPAGTTQPGRYRTFSPKLEGSIPSGPTAEVPSYSSRLGSQTFDSIGIHEDLYERVATRSCGRLTGLPWGIAVTTS